MNWLIWLLILVIASVIVIVIAKKISKKESDGLDLDSRLSVIKGGWDSVCAKLKRMIGC